MKSANLDSDMQSNEQATENALSGAAKSPLPKLSRAERAQVKRLFVTPSRELDPVVALRLALAAKQPVRPEWRTAFVVDMALETGDIAKRVIELAEGHVILRAPAIWSVLERRSRFSPVPVFRAICGIVLPRKGKRATRLPIAWDEDSAVQIGKLLLALLPMLFGRKLNGARSAEQILEIVKTAVLRQSADAAAISIELLCKLEHEAGWQALESPKAKADIEFISNFAVSFSGRLLESGDVKGLNKLVHATKSAKEIDSRMRQFVSGLAGSVEQDCPLVSRKWISSYLGHPSPEIGSLEAEKSSDAALERLALILITAWDARHDGEKSSYFFSLLREVLGSGFGLFLVGEVDKPVSFDTTLHESRGQIVLGESGMLVRPWVEYREGEDIQVMIKGVVEPIAR